MFRRLATACLALAAAAPAHAQARPKAERVEPPIGERTLKGACSDATSRNLFTACDADGDDRLDVFEASSALDTVRNTHDAEGFARVDKDRDGYVSWPEFHAKLRSTLSLGGTFRVRTCRPLAPAPVEPKPATPLQSFVQLHDANRNGGLDPDEIDQFLKLARVPQALGTQLRALDVDGSGRVEEAELAPWYELSGFAGVPDGAASSLLLPPWSTFDADRNNAIDANELRRVLRRLDPALDRWQEELLRRLDKNGDGTLQADELPGPPPGRGSTAAALPQVPAR